MKVDNKSLIVEFNKFGLPILLPDLDAQLDYKIGSNGVLEIEGNEEGLILLARSLLGVASCDVDDEYHVHLDELYKINSLGHQFILRKK